MKRARPFTPDNNAKKQRKSYTTPIGVLATVSSKQDDNFDEYPNDFSDNSAGVNSMEENMENAPSYTYESYQYNEQYEASSFHSQDEGSQSVSQTAGVTMNMAKITASPQVNAARPALPPVTPKSNASSSSSTTTVTPQQAKQPNVEKLRELERLVNEERNRMKKMMMINEENRDLYNTFNDLQGIANEYKMKFDLPEIVVVGMQSDGKSSFVEALLGFQFNTIDTQIGTRRPLILQMITNEKCESPHCVFWKEDMSVLEDESTPVSEIEKEIRRRTDELCGKTGVSSKPIILRVNYKYCANLTVYDTPGFRKGPKDPLGGKIMQMVLKLLEPPQRIIVCLEQSTVEWCNTQVRPVVQKVDPNFSRTVIVTTKFNNRANQFKNKEEIDGYLSTDGHIKSDVFFISLPSGPDARDLSAEQLKEKVLDTYLDDFRLLTKLGYDEKYKPFLGFLSLKKHLESILHKKYRDTIVPVFQRLEQAIEKKQGILEKIKKDIRDVEGENVEDSVTTQINSYIAHVQNALNGTTQFNTLTNGFTLEDEKKVCECSNWPNFLPELKIRNSQYKLYGGAQLERLLAEFEIVAHSQEFPQTTDDEVAVTIGLNSLHTTPDYDRGASDLAQKKCKTIFGPLIDVLMQRSKFIMRSLFKIVLSYMQEHAPQAKYKVFFEEIQKLSEQFIEKVLVDVRSKTDDEFDTFTKIIDWDLIEYSSTKQVMDYDLLTPSKEDTLKRVQTITAENMEKFQYFGNDRSRELTEERCRKIKTVAAKLFAGVRMLFVKYIRAKYNAFFLAPIFSELDSFIRMHFTGLGPDKLKEMFGFSIVRLKKHEVVLVEQIQKLETQKAKFKKLTDVLNTTNKESKHVQ